MADEFLSLTSRDDLQRLVDEALEESLTLDYKASPALSRDSGAVNELCKDVSAFANSVGGQIVYGIVENRTTHRPERIDEGVSDPKITREWIEQTLTSKVQPRLQGVRIIRIELSPGRFAFVINVPRTSSGPHQAPDKKYYRRFELQSVPMEDYEIKDVLNRKSIAQPFLQVQLPSEPYSITWGPDETYSSVIDLNIAIGNRSNEPAMYVFARLLLDRDFIINAHGGDNMVVSKMDNGEEVYMISFKFVVPNHFPIFKEERFACGKGTKISIPQKLRTGDARFFVAWNISTPGFTDARSGYFMKRGESMAIRWHPPESATV